MIFPRAEKIFEEIQTLPSSVLSGLNSPEDLLPFFNHSFKAQDLKHILVFDREEELLLFSKKLTIPHLRLPLVSSQPFLNLNLSVSSLTERSRFLFHAQQPNSPYLLFLATLESLSSYSSSLSAFKKNCLSFEFADTFLTAAQLESLSYTSSPFVEKAGQFCDKGGIVDIFPPSEEKPLRLELFGEEIESIRSFDPDTQLTLEERTDFQLCPAKEFFYTQESQKNLSQYLSKLTLGLESKRELTSACRSKEFLDSFFLLNSISWKENQTALDYFDSTKSIFIFLDKNRILNSWEERLEQLTLDRESLNTNDFRQHIEPNKIFKTPVSFSQYKSSDFCPILLKEIKEYNSEESEIKEFNYSSSSLRDFLKSTKAKQNNWSEYLNNLQQSFENWIQSGFKVIVFCPNTRAIDKTQLYLKKMGLPCSLLDQLHLNFDSAFACIKQGLSHSIKYNDEKLILLNYSDIFESKSSSSKKASDRYFDQVDLIQIADLKVGDRVVHIQHGVGVYKGLKLLDISGVPSECIELHYSGQDKLFIPVHKINQIRKSSGQNSHRSLDKLGSQSWLKTTLKVKSKLKDIAEDLVQLYSKRRDIKRKPLAGSSEELSLFHSQFPYEETIDQQKAIDEVYLDLEKDFPMDRLICGDVGFGKTEVAMRAAFQFMSQGKQVAVLAPTTVLSLQHYNSFCERFKDWPFEIRALNRFISGSQVKDSLKKLEEGKVDLIVGTHRLLSSDVKFKNLALLIIDEEQKFGVKQKEKIALLKNDIDLLSLSATPIPRTLNMGFLGVRDLSLITTPPKNRLPVKTYVSYYSMDLIKRLIESELKRKGQVYFVHNRVQSIHQIFHDLKESMPDLRVGLGHGQMPEKELESVMLKFFNQEIDVLLSTTIIESGVDVSTANTMIINNAQNFGLSQLYQLRGRVGRSEKRAFCYLLVPPNRDLEKDQKKKLKVLQDNTELGSGIQIAHHDLELRGAGNLLGEAQSGHAEEIGYDLYVELLQEAVQEAKGEEHKKEFEVETSIALPALIPSDYIKDIRTRLFYYRKLNKIREEHEIDEIENEIKDQFGKIPEALVGLFFLTAIKRKCVELDIQELKLGPVNLSLKFTEQPSLDHNKLFKQVQLQPKKYKLSPDQRLIVRLEQAGWEDIYNQLEELKSSVY